MNGKISQAISLRILNYLYLRKALFEFEIVIQKFNNFHREIFGMQ
jgi:hypothetical protein